MAEQDTAYRTADLACVAAWHEWLHRCKMITKKREALTESLGRKAWVNNGSGHGSTRIVGFERFDSEADGDLIGDALVVSSQRGQHHGLVVPNLRRKAGKDYETHLREYTTPGLNLPGMPSFHVYASGQNMYSGGPALWEWDGVLYAFWPCDNAPVKDNWEQIPLSIYYTAKEQYDAANKEG